MSRPEGSEDVKQEDLARRLQDLQPGEELAIADYELAQAFADGGVIDDRAHESARGFARRYGCYLNYDPFSRDRPTFVKPV